MTTRGRVPFAGGIRLAVALLFVVAAACGSSGSKSSAGGQQLKGLFKVDAGTCAGGGVTSGSWFRMVRSGGTVAAGPYISNGDSSCGDRTWTPLRPGADGGLRTGAYQPLPQPAFDPGGNGVAAAITEPTKFFAVNFALSTNANDPQTKTSTAKPSVAFANGRLTGDLRALAVAWNGQYFNQGSPKPDGSRPGNTSGPKGSYDSSTHRFVLEWTSQIVGGPFNNFTGLWHLEGTFQAG